MNFEHGRVMRISGGMQMRGSRQGGFPDRTRGRTQRLKHHRVGHRENRGLVLLDHDQPAVQRDIRGHGEHSGCPRISLAGIGNWTDQDVCQVRNAFVSVGILEYGDADCDNIPDIYENDSDSDFMLDDDDNCPLVSQPAPGR